MNGRRKLIEVALPLEAINAACKRDKDRKVGTIRNLHKWFAPMPLPAWRAMLAAALLDDPGDAAERRALFTLIEGLVSSDVKQPPASLLEELTKRIALDAGELPIVVDPFCGGGSTLVEAQRLGLRTFGSDLNPIPVLISTVLTTILPAVHGRRPIKGGDEGFEGLDDGLAGFVADLWHYARRIYDLAKERIGAHYPTATNGDPIIVWWWARTVPSPDPRYRGAHTPLVTSWWLNLRRGAETYLRPVPDRQNGAIRYEIVSGTDAPAPSKDRCLLSGSPITFSYIREQAKAKKWGLTLLAQIADGSHGRTYFTATADQVTSAEAAHAHEAPRVLLPDKALGFRVQGYGVKEWSELFTPRQQLALETFCELVADLPTWIEADGGEPEYRDAITTVLGLCIGKLAQASSMQVRWHPIQDGTAKAEPAFGRPDLALLMDFAETNPFGGSVGDWLQVVETAIRSLHNAAPNAQAGKVMMLDAREAHRHVSEGSALVATDPPYFSNFAYADLSEYFYIWLRRALKGTYPDLFRTVGAPRGGELIADPSRHKGNQLAAKEYFIDGIRQCFASLLRVSRPDLPLLVVYGFRQQETHEDGIASTGWEAVLDALVQSGLSIVGTWPIHGTGSARQRGVSSNALATYVLLVCRRRSPTAPLATRGEFLSVLRSELRVALEALRLASIAPVDLAQSIVGPGMAAFTRYGRVVEADGQTMSVRDALFLINSTLDELLTEREGDFDSDTRWAIAWFEQFGLSAGRFGVADSLSRAKNTAVNAMVDAGIVESKGGFVRLLDRAELPDNWHPDRERRLTIWEVTHRLIRSLEVHGEVGAGDLLRQVGGLGEIAQELGYRLYIICERKKWAKEALAYNSLVVAWPEIQRFARHTLSDQELLGV